MLLTRQPEFKMLDLSSMGSKPAGRSGFHEKTDCAMTADRFDGEGLYISGGGNCRAAARLAAARRPGSRS